MTKRGEVTVTVRDGRVHLVVACGTTPVAVLLPPDQAREMARLLRNAADFADAAAMGPAKGSA